MQTFFSTSFFDFRVASPNQMVSSWVWVYFVLTIALTVIVLASWHLTAHRKQAGLQYSLRQGSPWSGSMRQTCQELTTAEPQQRNEGRKFPEKSHAWSWETATSATSSTTEHNNSECNSQHDASSQRQVFPASKVIFKGVMDDEKSCACCARPL